MRRFATVIYAGQATALMLALPVIERVYGDGGVLLALGVVGIGGALVVAAWWPR